MLLSSIDEEYVWSAAKHWAQWWTRAPHLKMLSQAFTPMQPEDWSNAPTTTNAVERQNSDSTYNVPQPLKLVMSNLYKLKMMCCKHIAVEEGTSVSYRARDQTA